MHLQVISHKPVMDLIDALNCACPTLAAAETDQVLQLHADIQHRSWHVVLDGERNGLIGNRPAP